MAGLAIQEVGKSELSSISGHPEHEQQASEPERASGSSHEGLSELSLRQG